MGVLFQLSGHAVQLRQGVFLVQLHLIGVDQLHIAHDLHIVLGEEVLHLLLGGVQGRDDDHLVAHIADAVLLQHILFFHGLIVVGEASDAPAVELRAAEEGVPEHQQHRRRQGDHGDGHGDDQALVRPVLLLFPGGLRGRRGRPDAVADAAHTSGQPGLLRGGGGLLFALRRRRRLDRLGGRRRLVDHAAHAAQQPRLGIGLRGGGGGAATGSGGFFRRRFVGHAAHAAQQPRSGTGGRAVPGVAGRGGAVFSAAHAAQQGGRRILIFQGGAAGTAAQARVGVFRPAGSADFHSLLSFSADTIPHEKERAPARPAGRGKDSGHREAAVGVPGSAAPGPAAAKRSKAQVFPQSSGSRNRSSSPE